MPLYPDTKNLRASYAYLGWTLPLANCLFPMDSAVSMAEIWNPSAGYGVRPWHIPNAGTPPWSSLEAHFSEPRGAGCDLIQQTDLLTLLGHVR